MRVYRTAETRWGYRSRRSRKRWRRRFSRELAIGEEMARAAIGVSDSESGMSVNPTGPGPRPTVPNLKRLFKQAYDVFQEGY